MGRKGVLRRGSNAARRKSFQEASLQVGGEGGYASSIAGRKILGSGGKKNQDVYGNKIGASSAKRKGGGKYQKYARTKPLQPRHHIKRLRRKTNENKSDHCGDADKCRSDPTAQARLLRG